LVIDRYFAAERDAITTIKNELRAVEQELEEKREEQGGEEGLLSEVVEGEGDKQKITAKVLKARIKTLVDDPDYADERKALEEYSRLLDKQAASKLSLKGAEDDLESKIAAKYPNLTENEIKTQVVDDKWLTTVGEAVNGELDHVSHTLTGRIRQLSERYGTTLSQLSELVVTLSIRVDKHLTTMGEKWN
jgi:type I restriction enzyme M protein